MSIEKNKVVSFDYTLTDTQGRVLDSSEGREPLVYLHGYKGIIPGVERALEGKDVGDHLNITITPEDGYGHRNAELVQAVPRSAFRGVNDIKPGMQFQAQTPQGTQIVFVTAVDADNVTVDANHPLAGATLQFDINVRAIREATAEELQHGHAHGPGGHQH